MLKFEKLFYCLSFLGFSLMVACSGESISEDPKANVLVKSIVVSGSDIQDGNPKQLTVEILPNNATNRTVAWSVSNTSIATISNAGLLTPIKNGSVTVSASAQDGSGVSGTRFISISGVVEPPVLVESITINGTDITNGNPQQLNATVLPANATNKVVTWTVSNTSVADINSEGLLTPKINGQVTVTATATDGSGKVGQLVVMEDWEIHLEITQNIST